MLTEHELEMAILLGWFSSDEPKPEPKPSKLEPVNMDDLLETMNNE